VTARARRIVAVGIAGPVLAVVGGVAPQLGAPPATTAIAVAFLAGAAARLVVEAPQLAPWSRLTTAGRRLREGAGR
jgi:hypothetical protein